MKATVISAILVSCALNAIAQTDSISGGELREVVIKAPKVIRRADMDVYHPSQSAVENSKNGVQLLANLMIPAISVSDALGTITSAGQSVQVRINGRVASVDQVKNLLPSTIKRVEWIDNPGLRYGGASSVLNFIVTNPTVGGAVMLSATQCVNTAWGQYNPNAKFNFGRSQIEVGGGYKLSEKLNVYRDYSETFRLPDGSEINRVETPLGGIIDNSYGNLWASYNYIKPDTTVLVVEARGIFKPQNRMEYYGLLSSSIDNTPRLLTEGSGDKGTTPSLSVYLEQHLPHRQTLVVDFKAQYYAGNTFSDYIEQNPSDNSYIADINTFINDRNQAYAVEADYIKHWRMGRLTAGASYSANRNRSEYRNLGNQVFHQRQDKVYFFAEYFHRINKVTLTGGLGAHYTDFMFRETGLGSHSWNLRPQATITYSINPSHQLRVNFGSWQSTPTLAETNPTSQQIDTFQWRVGNPDLKTSNSYMLFASYNFHIPRVYGQFAVRAYTSPNAITPLLRWDADRLITTYENSGGLQNLSLILAPQIDIIPDWLMLSGMVQWRAERMKGTGYRLTNNAFSGYAMLRLFHWGFTLTGQYIRAQRDLWGERISWGEDLNLIDLNYNWKQWGFSVGCVMPFGKYQQGSESLSEIAPGYRITRSDFTFPYISVNYNLQWGRQKRKASKLVNVGADTDRSTAGGR